MLRSRISILLLATLSSAAAPSFTRDVKPIFQKHCQRNLSSGLSLRSRYHAEIRLRTSEYFHRNGLAVF
jgi:hypothetical protein